MSIQIRISEEAERRLREKAAAAGQHLAEYAAGVLERTARGPEPLEALSGPVFEKFMSSGMTDDALSDLLEDEKHALRREIRSDPAE